MDIRLSLRGAVYEGADVTDLWTWDAFSEGMGNV